MKKTKNVIVIGAGPAGLLAAYSLVRSGISVTVVDSELDIVRSPRAMVYLPLSIKALDQLGLLDAASAIGAKGYEYNLRFASGYVGKMDQRVLAEHTPYHYTLHFGQDQLADIVLEKFLALPNAEILWGHRFENLKQDADGVTVSLTSARGPIELRADWVIGADGARSSVRKALGIEFEGFTWPDTFMATNVVFDFSALGFSESTMVADPENWAVIAKINDQGLWRVAYGEDSGLSREEQIARVPERLSRYIPKGSHYELVNANPYRVHQRCATKFREGRVLLVGDAAHATNPLGGLGLTAGIQDAMTLSNALIQVTQNGSNDDWLDHYAAERRRVFLQVANPIAIEHKRRVQESDPKARAQDETNFRNMVSAPDFVRNALMSLFALEGKPYSANWRDDFSPGQVVKEHPLALFGIPEDL